MKIVNALYLSAIATTVLIGGCRERERYERTHPGVVSERDKNGPADQDKSGTTTLTGASWLSNDAAVDRIVASRCARELTCSNVGPDRHFTTTDSCVVEVRKRMRVDLDASECGAGVDAAALDKCLDAIRSESCSNPIDTVSRMATCKTSDLCIKTETPHR